MYSINCGISFMKTTAQDAPFPCYKRKRPDAWIFRKINAFALGLVMPGTVGVGAWRDEVFFNVFSISFNFDALAVISIMTMWWHGWFLHLSMSLCLTPSRKCDRLHHNLQLNWEDHVKISLYVLKNWPCCLIWVYTNVWTIRWWT